MFEVADKYHEQEIYTVYAVDRLNVKNSYFLIYDGYRWSWLQSCNFVPVGGRDGRSITPCNIEAH